MQLEGIRVVSFNHFLMGPVGVQFLADLGADVIAVEPPGGAFQRKWSGANNKRVAFVHPKATGGVLLELSEDQPDNG